MAKLLGYILGILGLVIVILSFNLEKYKIPVLSSLNSSFIMIIGLIIVVVGVVLSLKKGKGKTNQVEEEVPIYRGKKIVGYRRQK